MPSHPEASQNNRNATYFFESASYFRLRNPPRNVTNITLLPIIELENESSAGKKLDFFQADSIR
jgi:hypothetical protein